MKISPGYDITKIVSSESCTKFRSAKPNLRLLIYVFLVLDSLPAPAPKRTPLIVKRSNALSLFKNGIASFLGSGLVPPFCVI